jgi:uncharacterized protein
MNQETRMATDTSAKTEQPAAAPWWRFGMVWLVLSGPAAVVVASLVTAVVAWSHIDPLVSDPRFAPEVVVPADPKTPLAPAMKARNHAATPSP